MANKLDKSIEFKKLFDVYIDKMLNNYRPLIVGKFTGNKLSLEQTNRLAFALTNNNYVVQILLGFTGFDKQRCQMLFPSLEHNQSIEQLYLYDNEICDDSTLYIGNYLSKNISLKELSLNNNHLGDKGIDNIFTSLYDNKTLEDISLYGSHMSQDGSNIVAKYFEHNAPLKRLRIGSDELNEEGLSRIISSLRFNTNLNCLELEVNNISKIYGLNEMLNRNKNLQFLRICGCVLNDETIDDLSIGLKSNKTLRSLSIYSNNVSDKGAAALASALYENIGLEEIYLTLTGITERVTGWYKKLIEEKQNLKVIIRPCSKCEQW